MFNHAVILPVVPPAMYDLVEEEKLEDGDTESNYQYSPERAPQDQPQDQPQPDHHPSCWRDSILQLKEGLGTGAVQQQFDVSPHMLENIVYV
jgi:hypothetical protein